jgi:uncharacterized 2Fe-2S/4Fe-4S cluster protein (DUF4445 family)
VSHLRVTFQPEGVVVRAEEGELLLDLAAAAGLPLLTECGGRGLCGSCRVQVLRGRVQSLGHPQPRDIQTPTDVLACQTRVVGDVVVRIPAQARLCPPEAHIGGYMAPTATAFLRPPQQGFPLARWVRLELTPPSFDSPTPDWERVAEGLGRAWPELGPVTADLEVLRELPSRLRAQNFALRAALVDEGSQRRVVALGPPDEEQGLGLAVDIGTSTVKVALVNLESGRILAGTSGYNQQVRYGEDVISRIIWLQEQPGGAEELAQAVLQTINGLVAELLEKARAKAEQIMAIACAGNATMIGLLLRLPVDAIRRAPHIPPAGLPPVLPAGELGLLAHPKAAVFCLPAVNGYVGGDITAGVLATGLFATSELSLLVDVGTNGEIVLGNKEWMVCSSCSAGPAFEGMGIEAGLPARPGAIESVRYDPVQDAMHVKTIASQPPVGLCGNGLVEALASLFRAGVLDRAGHLNTDFPSPRVRQVDGEWEFVVLWEHENASGKDLVLRQSEIDNLLRSKGAVYAAISTLFQELGLAESQIERLYLAGAFGSHLDVSQAIAIGLLPDLPAERITVAGNTALMGAYITLLSSAARAQVARIARAATYLDLSTSARFMEEFVAALMLPHTNLERFPSVTSSARR